jgi:hypothetical protein
MPPLTIVSSLAMFMILTSPNEPNCNLNRQKWFVLLQAGTL